MSYTKKSSSAICAAVLLTVLLLCGFTFTGAYTAAQQSSIAISSSNQSKRAIDDSTSQIFEKYKSYDVTYNSEKDIAYYNGERIKLLVEFRPENSEGTEYAFEFCYQDSKAKSTLYLEAVQDGSGNFKEIRLLNEEVALELIDDMVTANSVKNDPIEPMTKDATQE